MPTCSAKGLTIVWSVQGAGTVTAGLPGEATYKAPATVPSPATVTVKAHVKWKQGKLNREQDFKARITVGSIQLHVVAALIRDNEPIAVNVVATVADRFEFDLTIKGDEADPDNRINVSSSHFGAKHLAFGHMCHWELIGEFEFGTYNEIGIKHHNDDVVGFLVFFHGTETYAGSTYSVTVNGACKVWQTFKGGPDFAPGTSFVIDPDKFPEVGSEVTVKGREGNFATGLENGWTITLTRTK